MKILKTCFLSFAVVVILAGCDTKEKSRLQGKVDSLTFELKTSLQVEQSMTEVGMQLDSIDASRKILRTKMVEGTSYADYVSRLKDINNHIKYTQAKLDEAEKSLLNSKRGSSAAIKRLKSDLAAQAEEIIVLQLEIVKMREENNRLWISNNRKDSLLSSQDEIIRVKAADVASLQGLVTDINEQNRIKVANLYYAQAQALETAANRTKFAPRKKKETRKEALELYKLSLSMGNMEAISRITELEKELN